MSEAVNQNVEQETTTDPWQTTIRAKGDFADVAAFVEDHMRRFSPTDYRTHVVKREELSDGRWQFTITRENQPLQET